MSYTIFTILYIIGMFVVLFILRSKQISLPLPNLMTVLGVLGTFIGIFIGLLGFDASPGRRHCSGPAPCQYDADSKGA